MSEYNSKEENELTEENQDQVNQNENIVDSENMSEKKEELTSEEKLAQEKDRYIRLFAEFDNYKKRVTKERQDLLRYSSKDMMESLLPIFDDFDRAINELQKDNNSTHVLEGIQLIYNKFFNTLKDKGLSIMEVKVGDDFNIDYHEAITQIPAPDENLKGKIVDVIQQGYMLHDKVIRYAKVVTGN